MDRKTILIIDDETSSIDLLSHALGQEYECAGALDGETALADIAAQPPDLILLDIMMPGMNGYEICRRLKADPQSRDIPVIFVTARGEVDDEAQGFALGAADYITKPFKLPIIRARVRTHLEIKAQRDQLRASISLMEHETEILRQKAELGIQAGCLAHDLNNILTLALGVRYLPDLLPDSVPEKAAVRAEAMEILGSVRLGCDICRGYTSYLRHVDETAVPQSVPELLQALDMYARRFRGKVHRELPTGRLLVRCKGHQLQRVFVNLFVNAMEALENRAEPEIRIRLWQEGQRVLASISDNGPGIPAAILPRIFEERFTTKPEGTGLGLFLVKQIVGAHNGTVQVQSVPGSGTTFTLSFPALAEE
ncbi:MAG: response regulator [Thermodesulfobacteriota bacterium]